MAPLIAMPLSTSNSDARATLEPPQTALPSGERSYRLLIWSSLVMAAVVLLSLEAATRLGFSHISKIERRIGSESRAACAIRPMAGLPSVLFVGNSLLLEDVDLDVLRELLPKNLRFSRFAIEQTYVVDWMYGTRRLFAQGSHPDVVILTVGPTHVRPTTIRGDYSAYYLFQTADIPAVASTLKMNLTQKCDLYLARYSLFYAGRNNTRNFVLTESYPAYASLLHTMVDRPAPQLQYELVKQAAAERLAFLRRTCEANGAKFVFLMPPGFFPGEEAAVLEGAKLADVPVLVPVHNGDFPMPLFRDGFHLSPGGAKTFTELLAPLLGAQLRAQ